MKILNVDYDNCVTNLTSSIQKHYGLEPYYKTNDIIDKYLEKDYDNVIIFLFDAMGNSIIDANTTENHFLRKHRISKMTSTYPPTTASCTISYLTGLNPISTGWLGWASYFKDLNLAVDNFTNEDTYNKELIPGNNIAYNLLKYEKLGSIIEKKTNGKIKYHEVYPVRTFPQTGCKTLDEFADKIINICNNGGKNYIYAYWNNPDGIMHEVGPKNDEVKSCLAKIAKTLKKIQKHTHNTIGIVSADHSMIDVTPICFYTYYDLVSKLALPFTGDARTPMFFLKDKNDKSFETLFNQYFEGKYKLFSKDEVIKMGLFGTGTPHKMFNDLVGDYVAVATDRYYFMQTPDSHFFKGHHAGATDDEASIPLIIIES